MNKLIIGVLSLLFVTGCITPKYKSPTSVVNDLYRNVSTSDTTNIAQIAWATFYEDAYLRGLLANALDSNLNLRVAINQIEQSREYFKQSKSAIAPSFNAGVNYSMGKPSDFGTSPLPADVKAPVNQFNFAVSASWEIDIWGKLRSAKQSAYARLLQQTATKNAIVTQLVSDVASSYYQLLMLDAQLRITTNTIENYTEYLETISVMKNSASVNEVAVQQAKAQLYGAKAMLPQLISAIEVTENYMCILLGKTPSTIARATDMNMSAINTDLNTGIPTQLLANRPDVMASENALRAAHWQFNEARASLYPALTLNGQFGSEAMEIKNWFDPKSLLWSVVGGLTQPLFNGRALRTQRNVAELQKDASLLNFQNQLLVAGAEVSNSLLRVKYTMEKAESQKEQVMALTNAYDYSQDLLKSGFATYLDVLAAQTGLFATELDLYQTYYDVLEQKIELYRALGGGWR